MNLVATFAKMDKRADIDIYLCEDKNEVSIYKTLGTRFLKLETSVEVLQMQKKMK